MTPSHYYTTLLQSIHLKRVIELQLRKPRRASSTCSTNTALLLTTHPSAALHTSRIRHSTAFFQALTTTIRSVSVYSAAKDPPYLSSSSQCPSASLAHRTELRAREKDGRKIKSRQIFPRSHPPISHCPSHGPIAPLPHCRIASLSRTTSPDRKRTRRGAQRHNSPSYDLYC